MGCRNNGLSESRPDPSKSTLAPEEFRCWKVENLRQYLTMRDLAKTGKKEELAMFFGMQVKLAVGAT